jgi:hypothetical protein
MSNTLYGYEKSNYICQPLRYNIYIDVAVNEWRKNVCAAVSQSWRARDVGRRILLPPLLHILVVLGIFLPLLRGAAICTSTAPLVKVKASHILVIYHKTCRPRAGRITESVMGAEGRGHVGATGLCL